jgi:hypothetical protein
VPFIGIQPWPSLPRPSRANEKLATASNADQVAKNTATVTISPQDTHRSDPRRRRRLRPVLSANALSAHGSGAELRRDRE